EGPADERCHHCVSQFRAPLSQASLEESPAERVAFPPESSNLMYGMLRWILGSITPATVPPLRSGRWGGGFATDQCSLSAGPHQLFLRLCNNTNAALPCST